MEAAKPGKQHKEKKHKEKKHKERKQQLDSEVALNKHDKHVQRSQGGTPAAPAAEFEPSSSSLPSPPLPFDGLSLQQLQFSCPLDFAAAKADEDEEVWVLRLPAGLPVSLLHGCSIHMPSEPPAARHLAPAPAAPQRRGSGSDPLQHAQPRTPAQVIGHVALDGSDAATHDVYRYREVLQEDGLLVQRLRVAGPAAGEAYKPTRRLHCVRVARLLSVSDDVRTVSRTQLQAAVAAAPELGAAAWDGQLPPSRLRTRIGGWRVVGERQQQGKQQRRERVGGSSRGHDADDEDAGGSGSGDEGSCSDEEFHEVVFRSSAAGDAAAAAASDGSDADMDGDGLQQQQQQQQGRQGGGDPGQRFYSCSSDDGEASAAGLKDDWDVLNERFNLAKFLLKLPVQADVAAAQQAVYPSMPPQQQLDDSSSSDEDSDSGSDKLPAAAAAAAGGGSSKRAAAGAQDESDADDEGAPFSDDEGTRAAAMDVDGDGSEGWDDAEDDKPAQQQQQQQQQQGATQPGFMHSSSAWMAPPQPLRALVAGCLGWAEQQQLAALGGNKPLQRRMTNVAQLVRVDWGDVCAQLDMDAMSDYQTEMLLKLLKLREQFASAYDSEGEALQLQLLLPPRGCGRRPHFMDTDAGYAHYQAAGAAAVLPPIPNARELDAQWAALLVARGAGKLATFVDTEALRARGFAWDDDPDEEQREGLHIEGRDGGSLHVPA